MSQPEPQPGSKRRRFPWGWVLVAVLAVPLLVLAGFMAVPRSPLYAGKLLNLEPVIDGRVAAEYGDDLNSPDPEVRRSAALALARMNTGAKPALPKLLAVMKSDPDADVRTAAADAVAKACPGPGDPEAAKAAYAAAAANDLGAALADPDKRVRMNAALGLMKLKDKARPAIPALIAAAGDRENETNLNVFPQSVRQTAVVALGEAAAGSADGVPTFVAILDTPIDVPPPPKVGRRDSETSKRLTEAWTVRRAAVRGLGLAGEHGREAAPKVRALLKGDPNAGDSVNKDDAEAAEDALKMMGVGRDGP